MRANSAVTTHFVGNILVESCKYADCFTTTPIPIQIPTTTTTSTSAPTNTIPAPTTPTFTSSGTSATTTSLLATISSHILSSTNSLTTTLTTFNDAINNSNTIPTTTATGETAVPNVPAYIRNTAMLLCITIMVLGIVGNVMVPIVIIKTKDMRNSTNIFLTNLSIADLLVLLICTPTVLVEVNTRPETWILGHELCKAVPFIELTVAHASVLTILAISFERYYAICEPLKAGYVCTKARAMLICMLAWGIAALFTSPILWVAEYKYIEYVDGSSVAVCLTQALTGWTVAYFLTSISIFFILPLILLIILYGIIAKHLISNKGTMMLRIRPAKPELSQKARKQVVFMLGTVVLSFFLCLLPFRLLTLWIILSSDHTMLSMGMDRYYSFLYFCRLMLYLNSAINPVLYNLMSTKFRKGFLQLIKSLTCTCGSCCHNSNQRISLNNMSANNIVTNTSSSILTRSSHRRISEDTHVKKSSSEEAEITTASLVGKSCSINEIVIQLKGIKRLKSLQQQETTIVMLESETQVLNDSPIVESEVEMDIDMDVDVDMDMAVHEMLQLNENKNNCESKHLTFCLPSILESTQI